MAELGGRSGEAAAPPRALLVRAEGNVFTAGVDVHVFEGLDIPSADELTARCCASPTRSRTAVPDAGAVHGLCLTAGLELALACDLLWASATPASGWWSRWWASRR